MVIALLALLTASCSFAQANLVQNNGFEDGAKHWEMPAELFTIDDTVAHTGTSSLKFSWEDKDKRKLALQPLALEPGKRYLISAWLRSRNVRGAYLGATFGIEWYTPTAYGGGSSPMGVGWDTEWTQIHYLSDVVSADASAGHVYVTMDWSGVGTAWIDDISVVEVEADEVLDWNITRGYVVGDRDSKPFEVQIDKARDDVFGDWEAEVAVSLCAPPWGHEVERKVVPAKAGETVSFDTSRLPEGRWRIAIDMVRKGTDRKLVKTETRNVIKRPLVQLLTVPQSGILQPETDMPQILARPYLSGVLHGRVYADDGKWSQNIDPVQLDKGADRTVSIPGNPPPGKYHIWLSFDSDATVPYCVTLPFTKLSSEQMVKGTVIGPDNLLLDRGKPWFPMFLYAHTAFDAKTYAELEERNWDYTNKMLGRLQGTPLGLMDYATPMGGIEETRKLLDACQQRNIRVALSVKDMQQGWMYAEKRTKFFPGLSNEEIIRKLAQEFGAHPALGLWYTNDELSTQYFNSMKQMRDWLHDEDPLHPCLHVHYELDCIRELAPTYDIWGPELYPWPADDLTKMVEWSDICIRDLPETAPFWGCLWAFRNEPYANEMQRALAYLAIARGAKGFMIYSYHDLEILPNFEQRWKELVDVFTEVDQHLPILLQPDAKVPCTTDTRGVLLDTVSGDEGTWLVAINLKNTAKVADIILPPGFSNALEDNKPLPVVNGSLQLELPAFDVQLVKLQ